MAPPDLRIEPLSEGDAGAVSDLIRRNLAGFEEHGSVLAATFRRLEDIYGVYTQEGRRFFVARDYERDGKIVGGVGLGSLRGLPLSEGIAEIRDLVVDPGYRGKGIGSKLLNRCLNEVKGLGYQRVYLETTPQMSLAQKLFMRSGFRAVTQNSGEPTPEDEVPCYFVRELGGPGDK